MASNSSAADYFNYKKENLLSNCDSVLQEIRKSGKLCDVNLKVKDRTISAHRVILATTVPYFHKMFCADNKENDKKMEILMQEFDPDVIEALVDYCYGGEIQIERENVESLIICAKLFELTEIVEACVEFITSNLSSHNVIRLKRLAEANQCEKLISVSEKYIFENFSQFALSEEFLKLSWEELIQIIENDHLKVSSEEKVYEAVIKWVRHDQHARTSLLPRILKKVRLNILAPNYLVNVVSNENLIKNSVECRDILDEVKNYHLASINNEWWMKIPKNNQRNEFTSTMIHAIIKPGNIIIYVYKENKWREITELTGDRFNYRTALLDKKIYVIGGTSNALSIFDLETKKWSEGKKILERRIFPGVATSNDCIYVCGGSNGNICKVPGLSSVEYFSVSQNEWKTISPLNTARYNHGAVALNGYTYAIGGANEDFLSSCEKYCPIENKWTFIKSMQVPRTGLGVAILNGKLYACGGFNGEDKFLSSCEVYDPETDSWSFVAPMQEKREKFSLTSCNGKLYAIGGYARNCLSSVEEYCPEKNEWKFVTPLPI